MSRRQNIVFSLLNVGCSLVFAALAPPGLALWRLLAASLILGLLLASLVRRFVRPI